MPFVEVASNQEFDYLNTEINRLLAEANPQYVFSVWARKIYGNGSGGFYIPIPSGDRLTQAIEALVGSYQKYDFPPTIAPPNSFPAMTLTNDVEYAASELRKNSDRVNSNHRRYILF